MDHFQDMGNDDDMQGSIFINICIYIYHKKVYSIWYPITSCMHTYSHHLSSMTSPPPKKRSTNGVGPLVGELLVSWPCASSIACTSAVEAKHCTGGAESSHGDATPTQRCQEWPFRTCWIFVGFRKNADPLWNVGNLHSFETINHAYYCQECVF